MPGTTTEVKTEVKQAAAQVQQKAGEVTEQAKQQAKQVVHQAEQEVKSTLDTQKVVAADELQGIAQALRQTSNQLRDQDQSMFADYGNRMADQVERLSTYLEDHDLDELVQDAEDFARRQPQLFLGGAFTLGLLAARFLKSTAPARRYAATYPSGQRYRETSFTAPRPSSTEYPYTSPQPREVPVTRTRPQG
jgi:glucan phosphorylase